MKARMHRDSALPESAIPIHPLSAQQVLAWIVERANRTDPMALITTVNLSFLSTARSDAAFARVLREDSALNVVDGWPVALLLKRQSVENVPLAPGADLTPALLKSPAGRSCGIFLLGDEPTTLAAVEKRGHTEGWAGSIRGSYSPPRAEVDDDAASERIVEQINQSGARILLVGFGAPRQEKWLARWRHRLAPAVGIGVGGSFKFVAWPKRRAPVWMRRLSLEWLHRVYLEPGRLGPRYAKDIVGFARLLVNQQQIVVSSSHFL